MERVCGRLRCGRASEKLFSEGGENRTSYFLNYIPHVLSTLSYVLSHTLPPSAPFLSANLDHVVARYTRVSVLTLILIKIHPNFKYFITGM